MLNIVFTFLLIPVFYGAQEVEAFIDDALNPVKVVPDVWHQRRIGVRASQDLGCERHNVYTCEEPPDTVSPEAVKMCTYRNQSYHEQVYRWVAGRGCLLYTPDFLFVGGVNLFNLNAGCFYGNWFAPCLEMMKDDGTCGCYPFDPGLEAVARAVREALLPAAHTRWERCFYTAQQCCSHFMGDHRSTGSPSCETTFDGWTCWPSAEAGTTATEVCSEFAYTNQGPSCSHYSSKRCYENGTWELHTDYSTCSVSPSLLRRHRFYIIVLSLAIVACLPAVFMFFLCKRLRTTALSLHRNLLIAVIVKDVLVIISRAEVYIDELTSTEETVLSSHGIGCRVLATVERAAANIVILCGLVEGVYLHWTAVTARPLKLNVAWLYAIGGVVAVAPVVLWSVMMALYDDHSCWLVYTARQTHWILDGPRLVVVLINTALIVHAWRVLLKQGRNDENSHNLSTAKATLSLMAVFSAQFLVTAMGPNTSDCTWEQMYHYATSTLDGLQGFVVAALYCYVNKEVHDLLKPTYNKTDNHETGDTVRKSTDCKERFDSDHPDMTYYDTVLPNNIDDIRDKYAKMIRSKMHVAEIISIKSTERLADLVEPDYETIAVGIHNEGYDALDRSEAENEYELKYNRFCEEEGIYYGFTNASSVSIECQDWIRCISSQSNTASDYAFSEFEPAVYDFVFPFQNHRQETQSKSIMLESEISESIISLPLKPATQEQVPKDIEVSEYEDCENNSMLQDIIQHMEVNVEVAADSGLSPQNGSHNAIQNRHNNELQNKNNNIPKNKNSNEPRNKRSGEPQRRRDVEPRNGIGSDDEAKNSKNHGSTNSSNNAPPYENR